MTRRFASLWILGFSFVVFVSVNPASADPTFSFTIETDTIEYTDGNTTYTFNAEVQNLLNEGQSLVYTLTPFIFPHPRRQSSVCTYLGCFPPNEGIRMHTVQYAAMQFDTAVSFDIYNYIVTDDNPSVILPISGNYSFDVRIHAQGAPLEFISYRFHLIDRSNAVEPQVTPLPLSHDLLSNYPNPFNPSTNINFVVEQTGPVKLFVFDILGRTVAELVNTNYSAGSYSLYWDAKSNTGVTLPSGSYWVYLNTPSQKVMHRIVLIR